MTVRGAPSRITSDHGVECRRICSDADSACAVEYIAREPIRICVSQELSPLRHFCDGEEAYDCRAVAKS